ncbi:hypothetical protein B0H11DRAFT_2155297 [Mycena galericulata]|nr:hypothetical protein B0H11DRAFT_2155297 [Mycena galericulata]
MEWYPYTSKTMLLLDICDNLPRLPVSESLMRTFIWILRECGAKDVPSFDALRKTQKSLRSRCGVPTLACTSVQGKNFCINDPRAIIRMECANPEIRSHFHLYPEINTNGSVSEIWHGNKLCKEINPDRLTPMFDAGNGIHYYSNELAELGDHRLVIPFRWIKIDQIMHADTYPVEINDKLIIFSDDVSGNRSKSWNKHWNAYMTNRALPRELLQHEFYVHFVPEQFREFRKLIETTETDPIRAPDKSSSTGHSCYRVIINTDPSDNPMQAEICSCMGATANHPCRKCKAGGTQEAKLTNEGYHAMFSKQSGEPRSKENIVKTIQHQIELACEGNESELKKSYTASRIKDKYTEYWINDILSRFKKAVNEGQSKDTVTENLKNWVKDHSGDIYSAFLTADEFDPPRDTPIELLHTILLGVLKYLWHVTHTSWTADQKKLFELRLQATNISGLSVEGIRAGYIVQYANSLIGRQCKILLQSTVFHIHDLVDETHFGAWKALGDLGALLWTPEIDELNSDRIDPSKMITKVKTHLLTHAPTDVHMFGPLLGAITEAFESFNGVFRGASILSNHRAPSRDIAIQLADLEGVRHRAAGGEWPLQGSDGKVTWTRCGPSACQLLQEQPILQHLLGWKKPVVSAQPGSVKLAPISVAKGQRGRAQREIIVLSSTPASLAFNGTNYDPNSEWYRCKSLTSQSQEICLRDSWVVCRSPVPNEDTAIGRITEILQRINSTESIVVLEQYIVQPERHLIFNMPFLIPRRREETVFLVLKAEVCYLTCFIHRELRSYFPIGNHVQSQWGLEILTRLPRTGAALARQ